jgi:hypothetical protein
MHQAANDIILSIRVGRSTNPADVVLKIPAVMTSPFTNLASSLSSINILQAPRPEPWVHPDRCLYPA